VEARYGWGGADVTTMWHGGQQCGLMRGDNDMGHAGGDDNAGRHRGRMRGRIQACPASWESSNPEGSPASWGRPSQLETEESRRGGGASWELSNADGKPRQLATEQIIGGGPARGKQAKWGEAE